MWTLKMTVTLFSVWGNTFTFDISLENAFYHWVDCETVRTLHEERLAQTVANGLLEAYLPVTRVITVGVCVQKKELPPLSWERGKPA